MHFMEVKETRKLPVLVIYSCYKDDAFTAVKRDGVFLNRYMKEVSLVSRMYVKGIRVLSKMVSKRVRGWASPRPPGL